MVTATEATEPRGRRVITIPRETCDSHRPGSRSAPRSASGSPGRPAARGDLEGGCSLAYDGLVIASASASRPIGDAHVLRSVEDAVDLHSQLLPGRQLAVIGAGFIGVEVAATAREMGLNVSVVKLAPTPFDRVLGEEAGAGSPTTSRSTASTSISAPHWNAPKPSPAAQGCAFGTDSPQGRPGRRRRRGHSSHRLADG
ncbi:FAD-dependent oxidoreductase [Streptomyces chartreusis]